MNKATISALHTGVPARQYSQDDITEYYMQLITPQRNGKRDAIRKILHASGVAQRYSVVDRPFFAERKSTQQRNDRYMVEARELGARVVREGLAAAGVAPQEVVSFHVVSCTGISIPGLDLLIASDLGMNPQLNRACVLGMGCYGAFPGIRLGWQSALARQEGYALVLSVELCTLHLQFDHSVETVVSTSLFADGAAMMLISGNGEHSERRPALPTLIDQETYCDYQTLDHMSFSLTDEGFYMYLSSYVPDVLQANVEDFVGRMLERHGLSRAEVRFWAIHPGSRKIVRYLQDQLGLSDAQVCHSLEILHNYGNMSSATVLFVLNHIIETGAPQPGDYGIMMAFGPGLTMEALLVQW
jgi:predicted naringenin-chalcone synthase